MQSVTIRPAHFKTRHGKILKIVRENYLRNDVEHGLGAKLCQNSAENSPGNSLNCTTNACIIVVDTNVVLNQIDILESDCIKNVVLPQTTLKEVKHRSLSIYKRIRSLITNVEKRFFVFSNEHSVDTWLEREIGETSNDYHDRLIRQTASFYSSILLKKGQKSGQKLNSEISLSVCLISDDKDCRLKAKKESIEKSLNFFALSSEQWIQSMPECPETDELFDKLSRVGSNEIDANSGSNIFDKHLPMSQLNLGIKSGKFIQAKLNILSENPSVGKIMPKDGNMVLIQGLKYLNRGVQNDVVCVELLEKSKWREELEEFNDMESGELNDKIPNGKVVGIIKRNWRQYCGMLDENSKNGSKIMFLPADEKIPKIEIETRQMSTLIGQRIVVCIDEWPRNKNHPLGHFIRALGKCGDNAAENEVILLEQDVPHEPFSKAVLACLPDKNFKIPESEIKKRVDFRHLPICSVDPPGCTDIDDTLHFVKKDDEWAEIGVHIADVSHFVRPGSALDEEAANRGTTVYLCGKRIDMVPGLLSSNLCSMRDDGDRLGFSVIWEMNYKTGEIRTYSFHKSMIRSRKSLTYGEAQMMIDDPKLNDDVTIGLRGLNSVAKILKRKRLEKGALTLASPEVRFHLDSETHDPIDLQTKQLKETNSMVEEFMLLANVTVAEHIEKEFPECAVLRRHPTPPASNFDSLVFAARTRGIEMNVSSSKSLSDTLDSAKIDGDEYVQTLLRMMATRCMYQAVYFCSGLENDYLHYGLAAGIYTHFTSPIRRYADILVHRLLAASIGADFTYAKLLDKNHTSKVTQQLNYRNRMSQYAQRASVQLNTLLFFKNKVIEQDAFVIIVKKSSVNVLIPQYGLEGTISFENIDEDLVDFNREECKVVIDGKVSLQVFDKVRVQISVDSSNIQKNVLLMKLKNQQFEKIESQVKGPKIKKSRKNN